MYLQVASPLFSVQTLKLNLHPFVFLFPLNPVPCREEILNKFSWLKDLVKIKRLKLKLTCHCLEKNLLATVTRPRSYPNPCFKNPWATLDTVGEGKRVINRESSINIYTPSCVKPIAGEKLLINTGRPVWHSGMT